MLEHIPTEEELTELLGSNVLDIWNRLCHDINQLYILNTMWNYGGKYGIYEYTFRNGTRTVCTLYAKEGKFDVLIIFGKMEREKFELIRSYFSPELLTTYERATTFHDGKWISIEVTDDFLYDDIIKLLEFKKISCNQFD